MERDQVEESDVDDVNEVLTHKTSQSERANGGSGIHSVSGTYGSLKQSPSAHRDDGNECFEAGEDAPLIPTDTIPVSSCCCGTNVFVYCSHFLSAWGDRMWTFAVGLFLVIINPDSLQLTAIFGLTMGVTVLLFGPIIGDWVDTTARLTAARVSLVVGTLLVVLCAAVIYCFIVFKQELLDIGAWTEYAGYALIIVLSAAENLASIANTIAVEKDWIVEISGRDENRLATMTATMKGIDLSTSILAPIATGQIITYAGPEIGALFIAGWNVVSVIFEYVLIWKVYNTVPALKKKSFKSKKSKEPEKVKGADDETTSIVDNGKEKGCLQSWRIFSGLVIIVQGWKTYIRYDVWLSGIALSLLYMTVLGFDNVTIGYAEIQGLSGSVIGIMQGVGGFSGIMGTLLYPLLRKWLGLPRTGFIALSLFCAWLVPCVVSIWLPGSPFDLFGDDVTDSNCTNINVLPALNATSTPGFPDNTTSPIGWTTVCPEQSLISVYVLMGGIVAARHALWLSDLSISQMFMETVVEQERGVVNGVQNSLNKLMDMIKFGMVVALPLAPQFGLLIIISYAFIAGGWVMYSVFLCKLSPERFDRGRLGAKSKGNYTKI